MDIVIETLLNYAIEKNLMDASDRCYARNRLLQLLKMDGYADTKQTIRYEHIEELLQPLCEEAMKKGLIEDTIQERDNFDCAIMDCVMMRPSQVIEHFYLASSRLEATKEYYQFAMDSNYIRTKRIQKNISYQVESEFGWMDITINCSKPEKDPKDIAKAKQAIQSEYPTCVLCKENEGFYGNANRDGRSNIRLVPITLHGETWYLQYSPYVYYNEHCIVLKKHHEPMKTSVDTFARLLDFVDEFPHYFLGANADLPLVGGSILTHDHYQGGNHTFAMAKANVLSTYDCFKHMGIDAQRLDWPLSVLRLSGKDKDKLRKAANIVLQIWSTYSDESCDILATTTAQHNTISTIARKHEEMFELDLVLRNNRMNDEYPFGIFHPHEEIHHIKKENIGIIEVMGLAVLPARLKEELQWIKAYILEADETHFAQLSTHFDWITSMRSRYQFTSANIDELLYQEIGSIFVEGLKHCGVFKLNEGGKKGFDSFMKTVDKEVGYGN